MRILIFSFITLCVQTSAFGLKALSENLRCEVHFFEAYQNFPAGYNKEKDEWRPNGDLQKAVSQAPLASYAYFKKIMTEIWHLTVLKPVRHEYPFVPRYEITYLEARLTRLGNAIYRFEHKVGHRKGAEFSLDPLEPVGVFIQHAITHDQFLHLTCSPE